MDCIFVNELNQEEPEQLIEHKTNKKRCYSHLTEVIGMTPAAACGCLSNFYYESKYRSNALQYESEIVLGLSSAEYTESVDNDFYKNFVYDLAGYGLCQWTISSRKKSLLNYAKEKEKSIGDLEMQLEFFVKEIKEYKAVWKTLQECENSVDGAYKAAYEVCYFYEEPATKETSSVTRGDYAKILFEEFIGQNETAKKGIIEKDG